MRNLATIQKIESLHPIPGADAIEVANVLGWHVVVKKGEFKPGDLCVYVEIDSIMPDRPEFEFLRDRKFKVKTIKLRGQISQGICFPLHIIGLSGISLSKALSVSGVPGNDVTELLGVTKYEPDQDNRPAFQKDKFVFPFWFPVFLRRFLVKNIPWLAKLIVAILPRRFGAIKAKTWPAFFPKTDETRVQVLQPLLDKYAGTRCYVTEKLDGSSISIYYYKGKMGVCSRNLDIDRDPSNKFWAAALRLGIEEKLASLPCDIVLQGELIGEGIQGNKYGLIGRQIQFFSAWDISRRGFMSLIEMTDTFLSLGVTMVPMIQFEYILSPDIDKIMKESTGKSKLNESVLREGIVIRPHTPIVDGDFGKFLVASHVSFKAVSPEFLLKHGE